MAISHQARQWLRRALCVIAGLVLWTIATPAWARNLATAAPLCDERGAITFAALVLAIVQVGPGIIMLPVLVWAWFTFPIVSAAVFTVYTVPLLLLDNILRPLVMARGLQTPMVIILAGVICGTLAGGLIGLFVGPVVLSVFYDLVSAWMREPPEGPPLAPRAGGNPTSTGGLAMSNSDGSTTIRRAMPGCGS